MGDHHLSLWLDEPSPARPEAGSEAAAEGSEEIHLHFVDADDQRVHTPLTVERPAPIHVEIPNGDAGFGWARTTPPVSVAVEGVADHAVGVHAFAGANLLAAAPLAVAAPAKPGPPVARKTYNASGRWKLLVVSEGFADAPTFFAATDHLNASILKSPPFDETAVAARFQMEALFWPSGAGGLFNTKVNGRLVFGDNDKVKNFVKKSGSKGNLTIVLVNKPVRGGAGGARDRPAWVTITSEPTETWEAVALHELGHSFGLADEYDDASQTTPEPNPLEPNVSKEKDGSRTAWAALCTPGHPQVPTCDASIKPPQPLAVVGTFEGARYHQTGRYRPTAECLMQRTDRPFCPVCREHIRKVI